MSDIYWFLTQLLQPFTALMLALGVCVFWPQPVGTPRRWWLKACYLLTYLYCTPLAAYTSTWWLERRYPPTEARPERLDAIVILGGGIVRAAPPGDPFLLAENSFRRCEQGLDLYRAGEPCPILLSGGAAFQPEVFPPISHPMKAWLEHAGVAPDDLVLEDQSRNTQENAERCAAIIRERGWQRVALVTSACHLWRAEHFFRRQGIDVIPVGCQYRTAEFEWNLFAVLPRVTALDRHHEAFHEFLGCVFLLVQGKW